MANNRTEAISAVNTKMIPEIEAPELRDVLNNDMINSLSFDKDVIGSETPGGGTVTIDFSDKDTATVTTAVSLAVSFTGMQNGMVKHLVITKQAANVISFSGANDATKNQQALSSMTEVCYRISNKDSVIYVEGFTPDRPDYLLRAEKTITGWNMVASENHTETLASPIDNAKIIRIYAHIVSDGGVFSAPLNGYGINITTLIGEGIHGGISFYRDDTGAIGMYRRDDGFFDDSLFSGTGTRGTITIEYEQ
jgi:hypothetical protein